MIYKNYTITENPEEGHRFIGFPTEQGADHDVNFEGDGPSSNCIYGDSVEDIKNEIDAMDSDFLKLKTRLMALNNAIECLMQEGYDFTASELIEIRDEIKDQLKDLQFDQETNPLPFPEK